MTRYPVRQALPSIKLAQASWALPLVGMVAMLPAAFILWLWGAQAGILVMTAMILATGALHEDGWADVWDAAGGSRVAKRQDILKDSRVGTYGVLAIGLVLLARWQGLDTITPLQLVAMGGISRGVTVLAFRKRWQTGEGLGGHVGTISNTQILWVSVQLFCLLLLFSWPVWLLVSVGFIAMLAFLRRLFKGLNGDGYGALIIAAEMAIWLGLW